MSTKVLVLVLAFVIFFHACIAISGDETLSGDSSIFGHLKETHLAEFAGERGFEIIEDRLFLANKNHPSGKSDGIEVLEVPSLKKVWTVDGPFYWVQPSLGFKSYAVLHKLFADEMGEINVFDLDGKLMFKLRPGFDGTIESVPGGDLFYSSGSGYGGATLLLCDTTGKEITGKILSTGCDYTGRSLNDSILITTDCYAGRIFSIEREFVYDSIKSPMLGAGARMARSKYGGEVFINWWSNTYNVDSSLKFQKLDDSGISAQRVLISENGNFGYLHAGALEQHLFAYDLKKHKRIWTEKFGIGDNHYFGFLDVIVLNEFICIRYDEIKGLPPTRSQPINSVAKERSPKSLIIRLDHNTGRQIDRTVLNGKIAIGYIGDEIFTVESDFSEGLTKMFLKVWE